MSLKSFLTDLIDPVNNPRDRYLNKMFETANGNTAVVMLALNEAKREAGFGQSIKLETVLSLIERGQKIPQSPAV